MKFSETRRRSIKKIMAGGAILSLPSLVSQRLEAANKAMGKEVSEKINHSACKWCYNDIPLEVLCEKGKAFGLQSIDLLGPKDWPVVQEHGLICAMGNGADMGIVRSTKSSDSSEMRSCSRSAESAQLIHSIASWGICSGITAACRATPRV